MKRLVGYLKKFLLLTVPACLVVLVFLELFFRFVVPASDRPYAVFDPTWKLLRYETTRGTRGFYTAGHLAQLRSPWRVNNHGWTSEIDYQPEKSGKTRIAIIGDSFVEAFQVAPKDNFGGVLRRRLGDDYEVYSFGFSGSPLSHYLQISRSVNRVFDPDILVFNLCQNDFHQSLCEVRYPPGMMCYAERGGHLIEGDIIPFSPNRLKRLARQSALVRYWYHNLGGRIDLPIFTREFDTNEQRFKEGGMALLKDDTEELKQLRGKIDQVVGIILRTIREEAGSKRIIMMLELVSVYDVADFTKAPQWWVNDMMERRCAENGIEFINLAYAFKADYEQHGERFESPYDSHWNEAGHRVVGEEVARLLTSNSQVAMRRTGGP